MYVLVSVLHATVIFVSFRKGGREREGGQTDRQTDRQRGNELGTHVFTYVFVTLSILQFQLVEKG